MHLFSTSRKLRIEEGVTKKTMYRNGIKKEHFDVFVACKLELV